MSGALSESHIVMVVADGAIKRILRRIISDLRRMHQTLSGDDSGLKTTWDEICAQLQWEQSHSWELYDETVRVIVSSHVEELPVHEWEAVWLQTEAGSEWCSEDPADRDANPVNSDDIVNHVTTEFVYDEARNWTNDRIRSYIERASQGY
jgi:hypothetical protein